MLDWNDVQYFLAIDRARTLLGAARVLRVEHSTVGRRLAAMEKQLGGKLFVRTPDGYQPTSLGGAILSAAEQAESSMLQIERIALAYEGRAEGAVRVTTSETFAGVVGRWISELRGLHPGITVELLVGNQRLDLSRREADLAVRFAPTREGSLICRRVATMGWAAYASRGYVEVRGGLSGPSPLAGHDVIGFSESLRDVPGAQWIEQHASGAHIVLRTGSIPAAGSAAAEGLGIAVIPCFVATSHASLVRLGPTVGARDAFLVVHPDLARVARIRVVMAFFIQQFTARSGWLEGREEPPPPAVGSIPAPSTPPPRKRRPTRAAPKRR